MPAFKLMMLSIFKALGLFALTRRLTRRRLRILCYHGFEFDDEAAFRPRLFIKPARFAQRLATLRRYGYRVLPLDEAIDRLYKGTLPSNSLVITVDDGFHNFQRLAIPHLQRYAYPATVYVTTYYVDHANPVFRLLVQYMFWKTRKKKLWLQDLPWSQDRFVDLADHAQSERAISECLEFGERQCNEEQRVKISEQLGELLEVSYEQIVRSRILHLMTPDELRTLQDRQIAVELHTHRHSFPSNDPSRAAREIADNRASLEKCIPGPRQHFCYPSGIWDQRQWDWLDQMHVKSSTTCVPGLNSRETPRHALKRFLDGDNIRQLEFEAAVSGLTDFIHSVRSRLARFMRTAA